MKKMSKVLSLLLVAAMIFSMAACENAPGTTGAPTNGTTKPSTPAGPTDTYTVTVKSAGGLALEGVNVYIREDSDAGELKQGDKTDANGQVSFNLEKKDNYVAVVAGVPKGYAVEAYYAFNGNSCVVTLNSSLIQGESFSSSTSLKVGDIMYDFEITTPEKETIKLSDVLAEKKLVMLNFWYSTCSWCLKEFPVIEEVYEQNSDKFEILALNPYPTDNDGHVVDMREQMGLTFPMAKVPTSHSAATYGSDGYPTTVFIDRYGMIAMIEPGAITDEHTWNSLINYLTADDYQQQLVLDPAIVIPPVEPDKEIPKDTWPTADEMAAIMNGANVNGAYRFDEDKMSWPFLPAEFAGEACLKAANSTYGNTYAILYAEVEMEAGQALGLDYVISCEFPNDVAYILVNGEDIYQISGEKKDEGWKTCYPWVATEAGTYELSICFIKDGSVDEGDDTIYVKNLRVIDAADIDVASYIPRQAAVEQADGSYKYPEIFLNEEDGLYHVHSVDGPLLLANLMGYTQFNEEDYIWNMFYKGLLNVDQSIIDKAEKYSNYALNSAMVSYCAVDEGLAEILRIVDDQLGFDDDDKLEWLKICEYFDSYGTNGVQLQNPVAGLGIQYAFQAQEGEGWADLATGEYSAYNCFKYDENRPLVPRGMFAKFVPEKSGVYLISSDPSVFGVEGWLFDENGEIIYTAAGEYINIRNNSAVNMCWYMEAGKAYYINIAFSDLYAGGYIPYSIEYLGASFDLLRLASPGPFTYDPELEPQGVYEIIPGGIKVVLDEDGWYRHDLGKDADGNQIYGSYIYVTFTGAPYISHPIYAPGENNDLIDLGAFQFEYSEMDQYILAVLAINDGDVEAAKNQLREEWGDSYEEWAEEYRLDAVLAGGTNGTGVDLTSEITAYIDQLIADGELQGCIRVNEDLAELLEKVMDKYTFECDFNWLKLCYYYEYLGSR